MTANMQNDTDTNTKGIGRIELYKITHWTKKRGWTSDFAKENFVR